MNEAKQRKYHRPEFKAKGGLEALRGVKTIHEIGQEYGAHPVQVGQWKKEIQGQASTLLEGKRDPKPEGCAPGSGTADQRDRPVEEGTRRIQKKSGIPCRDLAHVDRRRGGGGRCPAMRSGRRLARHGLCATKAQVG